MQDKNLHTPELRFPEFHDDWQVKNGDELFDSIVNKNHNSDLPILAITQEQGAVPREMIDYKIAVTDKSIESYKVVEIGDFIISLRSFQGGIEYSNYKGICSPAYIVLQKKSDDISNDFFKYYFKTKRYISELTKNLEGIRDGKMISYKQFSETKISFPTLSEQRKIALCLSSLDDLIKSVGDKIELLKQHKKGLMQKLFPKLTGKKMANPELRFPEFHDDWQHYSMETIFEMKNGYTPSKLNTDFWEKGTIPWFRMEDIRRNGYVLSDSIQHVTPDAVKNSGLFPAYSIIVATTATIGEHALIIVDSLANQRFTFLTKRKSFKDTLDMIFFHQYMFIIDKWCKCNTNSSGLLSVNMPAFKQLQVSIPSIPEQRKIAECMSSLDTKIEQYESKLQQLELHKQGLMQKMFVKI